MPLRINRWSVLQRPFSRNRSRKFIQLSGTIPRGARFSPYNKYSSIYAGGSNARRELKKKNPPYSFQYQARPICKEMFLNLHGITKSRFQKLPDHYRNHGLSVRIRGNSRRLPHNTLPQAVIEDVKNFLSNFAEETALLLPGRIPGFKNEDIQLLSSSDTKIRVWNSFKNVC